MSERTSHPSTPKTTVPPVIGHAGCRRYLCDMVGCGGLFHLQTLLRGWPPAARWQAAASSCCCCSLAMLPSSRWWRLAFDTTLGQGFIVVLSKKLCYTSTELGGGASTPAENCYPRNSLISSAAQFLRRPSMFVLRNIF